MEIKEMIERYHIKLIADNKICINDVAKMKRDGMVDAAYAVREDIRAYLIDEKKAREERLAKIDAIEGLAELRETMSAWATYYSDFDRCQDDEMCVTFPSRPSVSVSDAKAMYPRAAAYIAAEQFSTSEHHVKSQLGSTACDRILSGEDYSDVIAEMETLWSDYCASNAFEY